MMITLNAEKLAAYAADLKEATDRYIIGQMTIHEMPEGFWEPGYDYADPFTYENREYRNEEEAYDLAYTCLLYEEAKARDLLK